MKTSVISSLFATVFRAFKSDQTESLDEITALDNAIHELSQESKLKALESERLVLRMNEIANAGRVGLFSHCLVTDRYTCNEAFREIYELPEAEYPVITMDQTITRFDPAHRDRYNAERIAARLTREPTIHKRVLVMPDGREKSVEHYLRPEYQDERLVAMTGSVIDVTEQLKKEQQLNDLINRQKELFAMIGHELRTPVAVINMMMHDDDPDTQTRDQHIKQLSENILNVLDDLRVVIAPERALESKKVVDDPVVVVNRALEAMTPLLKESGMVIHTRIRQPEARSYLFLAQQLRQAVTNLVKNAAIHSQGTEIHVSFGYQPTKEGAARAILSIEDNGKGIPESLRETVFEAFGRGDTQSDGSGLGLFIVKQLAERLEGSLVYSTSDCGGACFTLTFPLHETDATLEESA